jgi:alpha-beta hydrolase superfamily lysophospholipase
MRFLILALTVFFLIAIHGSWQANASESLEEAVCGSLREPLAFWLWSRAAGAANPQAAKRLPNLQRVTHKTKDGRILRGYKLRSTASQGEIRGFVLVAQGNAMLADQLLLDLEYFSKAGIEAYVFDYRGYGDSEGRSRLKAIVSDYTDLFQTIAVAKNGKRFLYGISFGGVVLLNVIGSGVSADRVVIDSTPSRISHLGCPDKYDPVANFPMDGSPFLIIAGARDTVVPLEDSQELVDLAKARAGRILVDPHYAHPFMDADERLHQKRLELIGAFFADSLAQRAP